MLIRKIKVPVFYRDRTKTGTYYFSRVLPKIHSLKLQIESGADALFEHGIDDF